MFKSTELKYYPHHILLAVKTKSISDKSAIEGRRGSEVGHLR